MPRTEDPATPPVDSSGTDDTLAAATDASVVRRAAVSLQRGDVVGRYVVLGKIGAGGMGVVYAAYDPELDRKVAVKLVLAEPTALEATLEHRDRLLREAQAMAKLSHPNVVTVHDVGTLDGEVYIAMEFVEGHTLGDWMKEARRGWTEVVDVFVSAGRGLQAAHDAGVIHRDFKPDNVMIGSGRVRVMDFGLARTPTKPMGDAEPTGEASDDTAAAQATTRDAMAGTPAYMAPEQFAARTTDERTDQFAFCVALWEALYGQRPFAGDDVMQLATNVLEGNLRPPPRAKVPRWLRRVCERGVAVDPDRRFPDIGALLEALRRGRARARWRIVAIGMATFATLGVSALAYQRFDRAMLVRSCEFEGESIREVYDDATRDGVRSGLLETGVPEATLTADKVVPWLDDYADEWQRSSTEACMHASVDRDWEPSLVARSRDCLKRRRLAFESLLTELGRANEAAVAGAVTAAADLPELDSCLDADVLRRLPAPPDDAQRKVIDEVQADLAQNSALRLAGHDEEAVARDKAALAQAREIGWPPLVARAHYAVGSSLEQAGAFEDAARELEEAYFVAADAGAMDVAVDATSLLVFVVGYKLGRVPEALRWGRHGELALTFLGDPRSMNRAQLLSNLSAVHSFAGKYDEARTLQQEAMVIHESLLGPEHPVVARNLNNLAGALRGQGRYEEARKIYQRVLRIRERVYGVESPATVNTLNNVAVTYLDTEDYEQALPLLERCLEIRTRLRGPDHPDVATTLINLGRALSSAGRVDEARLGYERAVETWERAVGDHPNTAIALDNLANLVAEQGEARRAIALHQRALRIIEDTLGPEHEHFARMSTNLAMDHRDVGELDEAQRLLERALRIQDAVFGPEHRDVADTVRLLADVLSRKERFEDALPLALRALQIDEEHQAGGDLLATSRFLVARAQWETGGDRAEAVRLAEQAQEALREEPESKLLPEVEAWLRSHGG